jgi:uncharacterized membrane protein YdjX (TVP38/TMEM64 family)
MPDLTPVVTSLKAGLEAGLAWVRLLGPWGPIGFMGLYALATVLLVPGSLLTLGAGLLFGPVWGALYVWLGATLGSTIAFLLGRYALRDWVAGLVEGNARLQAIDRAIAIDGFKVVLLTRLSPVIPFSLLNYGLSVTQVSLRDYVFGAIGMVPGTVLYVYLGSAGSAIGESVTWLQRGFYGLGLLATIGVTVTITRLARKEFDRVVGEGMEEEDNLGG